jgi:hypothetical protein
MEKHNQINEWFQQRLMKFNLQVPVNKIYQKLTQVRPKSSDIISIKGTGLLSFFLEHMLMKLNFGKSQVSNAKKI